MATKVYYDIDGTPNVVDTRWTKIRKGWSWREIPILCFLLLAIVMGFIFYFLPTQIIFMIKTYFEERKMNQYFKQRHHEHELHRQR